MKLSQLSLADYNQLDSIPVINQDLSASGFTPVANTYYRHTGATTNTFTQGVIYLYDTAYHKLGESGGGGTTLNRYEVYNSGNAISSNLLNAIATQSKYPELIKINAFNTSKGMYSTWFNVGYVEKNGRINIIGGEYAGTINFSSGYIENGTYYLQSISNSGGTISLVSDVKPTTRRIIYYNDVEITV